MAKLSDLPLVQELGNIRLNQLEGMPQEPGVYLITDDSNQVYYISQSLDLKTSLLQSDLSDFQAINASKVCYLCCDERDLPEIVSDYINFYQPPLNAGIPIHQIKQSSVTFSLTPDQQIERYLEICRLIKELEQEKETLKQNIVTFAADYKRERGENLNYQGVTIVASERKIWEYSETVKELEAKVKQLKKQEQKNGVAKVAKVSTYPTVKGDLDF